MIYYIGAGSNLGDKTAALLKALALIQKEMPVLKTAPLFENPPLLPTGAPENWYSTFLNTVYKVEWNKTPELLLTILKKIESDCGRTTSESWAPRILDLDILASDDEFTFNSSHLNIPHSQILKRSFALGPLTHIAPELKINKISVLEHWRALKIKTPFVMAALNCTPDSFSHHENELATIEQFTDLLKYNTPIIDIGAESTRPGAQPINAATEIDRLRPILEMWKSVRKEYPWTQVSIDTRHPETAQFALDHGASILNDVEHLKNKEMQELAPHFDHIVFMHSLTVPADKTVIMTAQSDVAQELREWCLNKLESFKNIPKEKLIFDPGIGFNKTPVQSLRILQNLNTFKNLPVRLLIGHSRKSFMNLWTSLPYNTRDMETISVALALQDQPINILRAHNAKDMSRALLSYQCTTSSL
jgi:2-amino-4-hydroxy-6-hydroxymethyldihydropteridine diphosphokinase / dihydropteroate synthase